MNILFFCNRSSRFWVLGSGFSVLENGTGLSLDCLGTGSITYRLRVDYVSFTCRLRV